MFDHDVSGFPPSFKEKTKFRVIPGVNTLFTTFRISTVSSTEFPRNMVSPNILNKCLLEGQHFLYLFET